MIVSFTFLMLLVCFVLWLYGKFSPEHANKKNLRIYNVIVMLLALLSCLLVSLHFYNTTGQSVDRAWWPILALLGSLLTVIVILSVGGLIRNLIVFRQQ